MSTHAKADIFSLSVPERILLVEDIWDGIAEFPEEISLSTAQKRELDMRLEACHQDPDAVSPWAEVRTCLNTCNGGVLCPLHLTP